MSIVKTERLLVTPEIAQCWIDMGFKNRPITNARVDLYAADMLRGAWRDTGEPLMISKDGLIEGQHRCLAVIRSGTSHMFSVVFHDSSDVFEVLGTGLPRRAKDVVSTRTGHYVIASAVLRMVLAVEAKSLFLGGYGTARFTNEDYLRRWDRDAPALEEACSMSSRFARVIKNVGTSAPGFFFYAFHGRPWMSSFYDALCSGSGLRTGDPVLALRNWIVSSAGQAASPPVRCAVWSLMGPHMDRGRSLEKAITPQGFPYKSLVGTRVAVRENE